MDLGLRDRVAIVTGGSQGLGRAIALGLAAEGARLVICARRREVLEEAAKAIADLGTEAEPLVLDVTEASSAATTVEAALDRFGRVDIVVNNAGKGSPRPLAEQTDEDWRASFELNLLSAVRLSLAAVPHLRRQGWGRIVNIASRVGREPDPYFAPYAAAKAGLINFTKSMGNAFSGEGVLTNCIVPGLIRGEGVEQAAVTSAESTASTTDEVMAKILRRRPIPAGRLGEPEDVAGLAVFLASDAASWITGASFTVDGGITRSPT
ncbi:MAG: SDR family NAD(P)-dependent oxidoreductase [Acidimicrobiales bacterium]